MRILKSHAAPVLIFIQILAAAGCGKQESTGIPLQSNPLAGPDQAYFQALSQRLFARGSESLLRILGVEPAYAAVSSFNTLKMCVSEVVWELLSGSQASSTAAPLKPGLLDFSPTDTTAKALGTLDVEPGTVLKNIKFTIATKPELCSGANYAVLFNSGATGERHVTQDISFRFDFPPGGYTVDDSRAITLYLGNIVNGMVSLGAGLDDSSIQTVSVGQAQ
ncbi:MAG: hypothetical protein NDJ89_13995 [Oligoflexia bacterium]|nr:hypothetical protein [Oligoflexia bacterium]